MPDPVQGLPSSHAVLSLLVTQRPPVLVRPVTSTLSTPPQTIIALSGVPSHTAVASWRGVGAPLVVVAIQVSFARL